MVSLAFDLEKLVCWRLLYKETSCDYFVTSVVINQKKIIMFKRKMKKKKKGKKESKFNFFKVSVDPW